MGGKTAMQKIKNFAVSAITAAMMIGMALWWVLEAVK